MEFDCALFDVDGVLVDIRKSYNETIRRTVELAVKLVLDTSAGERHSRTRSATPKAKSYNRSFIQSLVTDRLILKFRQSGGFNNDTDTSYAITLALLANPPTSLEASKKFLSKVAEDANETGISSVESFLKYQGFSISQYKKVLSYPPKKTIESPLARLFDELFYGADLFRKQNKAEPKFVTPGLDTKAMIGNDKVAITERTLRALSEQLDGNLAMVTGRSRVAAEYSLGRLMKYFNLSACVFLEDEPRSHAKPNPYAIIQAMKEMGARRAIYAGDSTEDLLMAKRAEVEGSVSVSFVGIYGLSPSPSDTLNNFRKFEIKAVAKDVNELPAIIEEMRTHTRDIE